MKSSVTISLVPEVKGGPFVFWDDLRAGVEQAKSLGFDAVEVFPPGPDGVDVGLLKSLLSDNGLSLAAMGTGAGWVRHKLSLTVADAAVRAKAKDFIKSIIATAGPFGAPAIIGSMQGRHGDGVSKADALAYLAEGLEELGEYAGTFGVPLIYEPLNRYETNLITTVEDGVAYLSRLTTKNVKLLADLFHMNIEEADLAKAIVQGGGHIGHVHFVDSNRRPAGMGHTPFGPIFEALRSINYGGYLSAEAFAYPDPYSAAKQTIETFRAFASR